ncbi:unnamed protein product [Thlaspi arvense]|uniref:Squalene monooxygenase n=1 Tax=Thlaspi arvense TaxID=13288 RepID=A0AAU9RTB5_THLAR|nr:unnamed protein product [Thlaspi arvense]
MMVTDFQYLLGGLLASLLGLALLYKSKSTKKRRAPMVIQRHQSFKTSVNGSRRLETAGSADVIIVGAGVAGSALAHTLGKDGRRVHVIERDLSEPDRIVGELLQPGGYLKLIELGLEDCLNEIDAQRIFGYALYKDGKDTKLPYPLEKFHSDVAGRSFHNGRFIQRMREKAATLPNVRLEQGTVTSLLEEKGQSKEFNTRARMVDVPSCFVGLVLENCQLPHTNHGHVVLADPSPILFYPISSTEIRCLVDVPGQKVPSVSNGDMAHYLKTVVAPQPVASTINTLAGALYKVFCASPDKARQEMRRACFDYLSLGGIFSNGPVSLLSGLNPRPLVLVLHFFAVAIYGVGRLMLPFPSPKRMWLGARLISGASGIIFPIIMSEGVRQMFFPAMVPAYYRDPPNYRDFS